LGIEDRGSGIRGGLRAALAAAILLTGAGPASAHPAPFSYLDLHLDRAGLHGVLVVHDYDAAFELGVAQPDALLDPELAARLRDRLVAVLQPRLRLEADGRPLVARWGGVEVLPDRQSLSVPLTFDEPAPGRVHLDTVLFPYDPNHQTFINVYEEGDLRHQAVLDARRATLDYYAGTTQGHLAVLATFVPAGVHHILIGPDHILFLVGLLLLGGSLKRLAGIVTAFTLGHSITLSLAALDVLTPATSLVEPAIALTIVIVGVDNLLVSAQLPAAAHSADAGGAAVVSTRPDGSRTAPHDLRPWLAAVFGLIHGFGFASVLKEFGLPRAALGWSLFSFNVGVEVGQLAIVAVVASLLALVRRRSVSVGHRLALAGSVGVIAAGGYWFVQRVWFNSGA
jgi:hypothetical protein